MTRTDTSTAEFESKPEPTPPFSDIPEVRFNGTTRFVHPHQEQQHAFIESVLDQIVYNLEAARNKGDASHVQVLGSMGSGKSRLVETCINEFLNNREENSNARVRIFVLGGTNRGNQLSRDNLLEEHPNIEFVPIKFPNPQDPEIGSFFAQVIENLRNDPLNAQDLIVLNEPQWGGVQDFAQNQADLDNLYQKLSENQIHSIADTLPRFFNGNPIPLTSEIYQYVKDSGGTTYNLFACDSFNTNGESLQNNGIQIPSRCAFLCADEQTRGGFASVACREGSHALRALSLEDRRKIVDSILDLVEQGELPSDMVQTFVTEDGKNIKTVRVISDPDDQPVMIGEMRYNTTDMATMIQMIETISDKTGGLLATTVTKYNRIFAEIAES